MDERVAEGTLDRNWRIDRHVGHAEPPANVGVAGFEARRRRMVRIMRRTGPRDKSPSGQALRGLS
jgi:hypothetical protein